LLYFRSKRSFSSYFKAFSPQCNPAQPISRDSSQLFACRVGGDRTYDAARHGPLLHKAPHIETTHQGGAHAANPNTFGSFTLHMGRFADAKYVDLDKAPDPKSLNEQSSLRSALYRAGWRRWGMLPGVVANALLFFPSRALLLPLDPGGSFDRSL